MFIAWVNIMLINYKFEIYSLYNLDSALWG